MSKRFWNFLAKRYARQAISDQAGYERKLDITRRHFPSQARVLEFGCGTGSTALLHAPFVHSVLAVDYSEKMIAIAREKAAAEGIENVTFEVAELRDTTAADGGYDAVLGLNILHLMPDWKDAIGTAFSRLKPGGVFVSSTACLAGKMKMLRAFLSVGNALGILPGVMSFTQEDLTGAMVAAGFEVVDLWDPGPGKAVFIVARKPG